MESGNTLLPTMRVYIISIETLLHSPLTAIIYLYTFTIQTVTSWFPNFSRFLKPIRSKISHTELQIMVSTISIHFLLPHPLTKFYHCLKTTKNQKPRSQTLPSPTCFQASRTLRSRDLCSLWGWAGRVVLYPPISSEPVYLAFTLDIIQQPNSVGFL